jgi:uncharacterized 2Fe-2S/4Fe-4S cluster protein (DUF4445 family)
MHHLLLGLPVQPLAVSPFIPTTASPLTIPAAEIGFSMAPGAKIHFPPPIAGFVGSDHLAFLLAAGFGKDNRTRLGIDIGTNTEIALQARGRIQSCSTASGPAFEGAHITHGMRAAPGAIERVRIGRDGQAEFDVIGGLPPVGICGSGILDALAEMLRAGLINTRGRIQEGWQSVRRDPQGQLSYILQSKKGPGLVSSAGREIAITQEDIHQILLAKGAIRAGIEILMERQGIQASQIDEVVLAGAFGSYLDPGNAVHINLFPDVPLSRIHAAGNAAGAGARMMLTSLEAREEAASLAKKLEYLELTMAPKFSRFFANGARLST